jgi:hypothetical protein
VTFCQKQNNLSFLMTFNHKHKSMALILPVRGINPEFGENCYLAENATVVGEVIMGKNCSV